jgi:hypothetical protein
MHLVEKLKYVFARLFAPSITCFISRYVVLSGIYDAFIVCIICEMLSLLDH